jgi:methionyl aminopeptidase
MTVETPEELQGLRKAGRVAAKILHAVIEAVEPGVTTRELDELAGRMMGEEGAKSAPIVTYAFPGYTCISVNEEIAHGIPGDRVIQPGDVVNVDVSLEYEGFYGDNASTTVVEGAPQELFDLVEAARAARDVAISRLRAGTPFNAMGRIFEEHAREAGARVVRDLCSHGIGRALHEPPSELLGFYSARERRVFEAGQVITVEPFLSTGASLTRTAEDGWTLLNLPGGFSAQFEHTIMIRQDEPPEIFTLLEV